MTEETNINLNADSNSESDALLQLVTFNIADEEFAIDILCVQEIIRLVDITRVPNTSEFVIGVINLRGKVIPIIDLRVRLSIPIKSYNSSTRIIVVEIEGKVIGFIVDNVNEVIRINKSITELLPQVSSQVNSDYINCIAKLNERMLILLNLEKILANEKKEIILDSN